MATTEKQAPILVAEFPGERQLWGAVQALEERGFGRDFIGVLNSEDGLEPNGPKWLHLLSVLAPRRRHEEIRSAFAQCGATAIGNPKEMAGRHAAIPHPGAFEDHDMKLPMGLEYPDARSGRRQG
jgi:hypothetical protein